MKRGITDMPFRRETCTYGMVRKMARKWPVFVVESGFYGSSHEPYVGRNEPHMSRIWPAMALKWPDCGPQMTHLESTDFLSSGMLHGSSGASTAGR